MIPTTRRMDVEQAACDLRNRTLSDIPRSLDRLIYLASMRDYNTGLYYHDGLAWRFTQEVACEALADCHREAYIRSTHTSPRDFVAAWKKLEPYRVAVPVETDPVSAQLLFSSFKIALAILEARLPSVPAQPAA